MAITPILEIGSEVGPYRIEQLIGRGGMGVVYRATDMRLGRPVALKLLSPEYSGDRRFRARFERESRLAASIDHGGIVPIYDAGDVDGLLYIAMRFVDGSDLAQLLRRDGPLEPDRALGLVGQLAEALDAAHERGLIHRDVKPSNALVAREGTREHVYLADFGLTKTSGPESVTASGQLMGTVAYMAPEVIRGEPPGPAADLYALGCVLFECLTGEVPFTGTNEAAVIYAHLESPPPRPRDRAPGLPAGLDAVLARSMAKEPDERFESGAAMVEAADVALGHATARRTRGRRRARPRRRGVVAAVGVAAVAVTVAAVWPEGDRKIAAIESDAVAEIDPGERSLRAKVELDGPPSAVAAAPNAIWVAGDRDGTVSRIDPETHTIRQTIPVGHGQSALAADRSGVWVANRQDGTITLVSADTNDVADTFKLGSPTDACLLDGDVWVAGAGAGAVTRLDPDARRSRDVPIDGNPLAVACGAGGVWAVSDSGRLNRIDPATNAVSGVDVGAGASALAVGGNDVWVANSIAGTVSRVNAERAAVTAVVALGPTDEPVAVAVGAGGVWVANRRGQTLARIDPDPERPAVAERFRLGSEPRALTIVEDRIWVAVAATGAGHRGGTLRVQVQGPPLGRDQLDPAISNSVQGRQMLSMTNDGLTAFRRVGGSAGTTLVPDLAETLPTPSDGGRTYRFTVRRGIRFSDGRPVRPSDVKRGIERSLGTKEKAFGYLDGIASVAADDAHSTIEIRLRRADPDFLYRLALPFAFAVPPGTGAPPRIVAATGPYRITRWVGGVQARFERNRFFRTWSALAKPDGYPDVIDAQLGISKRKALDAIREGRADWTRFSTTTEELAGLRRTDPGLVRETVPSATIWLFLNTRVPPFDQPEARRAVSLAIDRRAVIARAGGPHAARATCHLLPPSFPGYRPGCPSGASRPDLPAARRLVARSGTRGARVVLWTGTIAGFEPLTPPLARALRSLGYRVTVRHAGEKYFERLDDPATHTQAGPDGWIADYPSPSKFLDLFSCRTQNQSPSRFCDPGADSLSRRAGVLQASDPRTADALWARAERRMLRTAPAVPLFNPVDSSVVSTRLRNDQYSPQYTFLPDQAWVR